MSSKHQNKYALVTGGNKDIGFAICQGLLKAGFEVILAARSLDKPKEAIDKLQSSQVHPLVLDVADDNSIHQAVEAVCREFERIDILINNAGIYPDEGVNILTKQGADTPIWLATEASSSLRGKFFRDRQEISY